MNSSPGSDRFRPSPARPRTTPGRELVEFLSFLRCVLTLEEARTRLARQGWHCVSGRFAEEGCFVAFCRLQPRRGLIRVGNSLHDVFWDAVGEMLRRQEFRVNAFSRERRDFDDPARREARLLEVERARARVEIRTRLLERRKGDAPSFRRSIFVQDDLVTLPCVVHEKLTLDEAAALADEVVHAEGWTWAPERDPTDLPEPPGPADPRDYGEGAEEPWC